LKLPPVSLRPLEADYCVSRNNLIANNKPANPWTGGLKPSTAFDSRYENDGPQGGSRTGCRLIEQAAEAQGLRPPPPAKSCLLGTTQSELGGVINAGHSSRNSSPTGHWKWLRNVKHSAAPVARLRAKAVAAA